jgi:hypothetical protein
VPGTAQAALVFLVAVVPGFLAMGGYRLSRAVPDHPEGLVATARVIAVSAFIAIVAWRFGGRVLYQHARSGTALTTYEPQTYRFALDLLILPGILGFALGQIVDAMTHRAWTARSKLPEATEGEPLGKRLRRTCLVVVTARLLPDGPTTWDRTWNQIRRTEPSVLVRVTTKGGREIVGAVAGASRVALSPQPRDLYIQKTVRQADDGHLSVTASGLGTFIVGSEIESVEWSLQKGDEANG